MASFEIVCEHCHSRYVLPVELREQLRGAMTTCSVCTREWTPLPADSRDLPVDRGGWLERPRLALHPYLQANPYLDAAASVPETSPVLRSATQPVRASARTRPNLRVLAIGPGLELDAVFELGRLSFLIGGHGTHLELMHASTLPDRAIRIRSVEGGFEFEGIDGYLIPIGPVSVAAGRIETGARLELMLGPYRVALEASSAPGGPIRDLDDRPAAAPPPMAPVVPPKPTPAPAPAPVADMSQTVRGLGALGFDTRAFSNPLDNVDVGFLGLDPPVQGESFWFKKSPSLVGRTTGDVLIADTRVSGKHAQIDVLGVDQYSIKDLASTNGTTVNDRAVSTTRLKDGDVVGFGGVRLRFVARPKRKPA
ncbi:MAG TPA: FHA domain-containing protein [Thermoanaerobaculia bacterium]|nr:FHA domain-containing protein [Thermoanaerobaculia bacterium]